MEILHNLTSNNQLDFNSTNFELSTPLRAAFHPLNTTMNNIKTDSMSVEEVDTFSRFQLQLKILRSLNNKFTLCAGSSVGKCISNWIASTFECIGCSSAYEPFNYVMGNHSTGISNITMTAHMEMNGMQSLVLNNKVMDVTRSCENYQM